MRERSGSAKAAVLPVPVWAVPSRSRPSSSGGMDWAWMGVGASYPMRASDSSTAWDRPRSANVVSEVMIYPGGRARFRAASDTRPRRGPDYAHITGT